jgi:hypothetical protein
MHQNKKEKKIGLLWLKSILLLQHPDNYDRG